MSPDMCNQLKHRHHLLIEAYPECFMLTYGVISAIGFLCFLLLRWFLNGARKTDVIV